MKEMEILGENIRRYRQFKGLRQKDFAAKVGLSKDYISRIEKAKQPNLGLKHLIAIQRELGVGMEELFAEEPEARIIKLVVSDKNAQSLEKLFVEIISILAKKEK